MTERRFTVGKSYVTRGGDILTVIEIKPVDTRGWPKSTARLWARRPFVICVTDEGQRVCLAWDGHYFPDGREHGLDIVAADRPKRRLAA